MSRGFQPRSIKHGGQTFTDDQRCDDVKARDAVQYSIVEIYSAAGIKHPADADSARQCGRNVFDRYARRCDVDEWRSLGRVGLRLQCQLRIAASDLPITQRNRHRDADGRCNEGNDQPSTLHYTRCDNSALLRIDMRIIIVLALVGVLVSLGSALVYLIRDKGTTNRTVNALTVRVGISVALFLFILFSYWMGWIEPRSY